MFKQAIHTTISKECRDWLRKESADSGEYQGLIIEKAINFYRNNRFLLEEYNNARTFLKELIRAELQNNYIKARPLLSRLIEEEIKRLKIYC